MANTSASSTDDIQRFIIQQKIDDKFATLFEDSEVYYNIVRSKNSENIHLLPSIYKYDTFRNCVKSFKSYGTFAKNNDVYIFMYSFAAHMLQEFISVDEYNDIIVASDYYLNKTMYKNVNNIIEKIKHIIIERLKEEIEERYEKF